MDLTTFLERVQERKVETEFQSLDPIREKYELLESVDFGCRFDSEGRCSRNKVVGVPPLCCRRCGETAGYVNNFPEDRQELESIARLFDEDFGFWTTEGCALLWKYRSRACVTYRCPEAVGVLPILPQEDMKLLASLGLGEENESERCFVSTN